MDWLALGLGVVYLLIGLAFVRPMRRGVRHTAMPSPRVNVIIYLAFGIVFLLWALIEWLA